MPAVVFLPGNYTTVEVGISIQCGVLFGYEKSVFVSIARLYELRLPIPFAICTIRGAVTRSSDDVSWSTVVFLPGQEGYFLYR